MTSLVATVIALTDRVHDAIDAGDWPRAQELETQRRELLEQLAAAPDTMGEVARTFAALDQRTRRLIGLVEHHKRRVLREAAVARTAHDGAAAYADNSGGQPTVNSAA
jgi:erythromycin esterase-like protein